jgi:parvulin-like peptidyl-prolyl isomerase
MLMPKMERADQLQVDGTFGRGMYSQLLGLEPGKWSGPVVSGYGSHVVRVTEVVEPTPLSLDKVRNKAIADWRNTLAVRLRETNEATLLAQYTITRPDADTLKQWITQ